DHLGLMNEDGNGRGYIYLVGSDDPAYADLFGEDMDMHQYVIGTVGLLYAKPSSTNFDDNKMKINFDLTNPMETGGSDAFDPKEGYSYTMHIHVEEKTKDNASITSSCYGNMNLVMKVVPEYLVWAGTKTADNWHDDALWKRIPSDRINKVIDESSSDYFKNGSNTTEKAYVPMLFTKVIMPKNSQVELYKAGFEGNSGLQKDMSWKTERPDHINPPAIVNIEDGQPIYYDMMVYSANGDNTDMVTKPFRVSLLDEIHFEPGAEMKHAEYLLYNKAWVDYQLTGGRWYALSSPLKGVVSGDFYTDPSGMEAQEYFTDITFDGKINGTISSAGNVNENNSRTNPSVYQRGWKGDDVTMVGVGSGDTGERAIAGNWSAVYNKADEGYDAGTGFSLKVLDLPEGTNNATFRLPKADTKYTYSGGTTTAQETDPITRTNANKLHVTDLNSENTSPITVTLEANGNNPYYLVGNPFMAHLDMSAFFNNDVNGSVLEKKYWLVTDGNQTAAVGTEGSWVTVDGNSTPTVAPLQSFFVQKKTGVSNNDITFTQDMQTLGGTNDGLRSANALTITATTTDGRTSRAAVAYDMAASADYEASEDAELFLDSNLGDVPMVYTVAGTMATSINRTSELYNIPLGVYGSKQEMVTLSFGGLTQFSSATLYDAQEQTETPLHEGKTVSVPAGTSGRYFLRAGTPTGNEVIARNAFLVYSVGGGKVMVTSSNTPLKDIRVYTMGGAQVRSIQASGMQQEIYLNRGIYLITVSDQDGLQETRKVLVR
ncbi:MAG: T9SS type A sorting domain-containing protein, partial [Bacteroidales bacterium]|nr:T9SS type A sorting domain-containing protein [Bacteroidales bacterium]